MGEEAAPVWLCEACGEFVSGDLCPRCGRSQPLGPPEGPEPGSYASLYGLPRNTLQARFYLAYILLFLLATCVVPTLVSQFTSRQR